MARPEFAGATKAKLVNKEVLAILAPAVANGMGEFFVENSEVATAIIRAGLGKKG
jgi:DNA gyrase/topoisomerase IV subunit B